jgi:tRNA A-37 threonylcarbamoyl transferase component Bud32
VRDSNVFRPTSFVEGMINRKSEQLLSSSINRAENIKLSEIHRLNTFEAQKHKIVKLNNILPQSRISTNVGPISAAQHPMTHRPSVKAHKNTSLEKIEKQQPATARVGTNPSTLSNPNRMFGILEQDKDLKEMKAHYRDQFKQLHRDYASDSTDQLHSQVDHENLKFYKVLKPLGDGSSAVVHLVSDTRDDKKYAMKAFLKSLSNGFSKANVIKEAEILAKLNHPNIIKLHEWFEGHKKVYLLLEYVGPMTLAHYLENKKHDKGALAEDEAARIFHEVGQGLAYLHSKRIYHRDVKLHNVMIGKQGQVKIIDLGYGVETEKGVKVDTFCGTPSYMSPEVIAREAYIPEKYDVWSFGVCLFKAIVGRFPFVGLNPNNLFFLIKKAKYELPPTVSSEARTLIAALLHPDPEARPTMKEALQFKWFDKVNFESTAEI